MPPSLPPISLLSPFPGYEAEFDAGELLALGSAASVADLPPPLQEKVGVFLGRQALFQQTAYAELQALLQEDPLVAWSRVSARFQDNAVTARAQAIEAMDRLHGGMAEAEVSARFAAMDFGGFRLNLGGWNDFRDDLPLEDDPPIAGAYERDESVFLRPPVLHFPLVPYIYTVDIDDSLALDRERPVTVSVENLLARHHVDRDYLEWGSAQLQTELQVRGWQPGVSPTLPMLGDSLQALSADGRPIAVSEVMTINGRPTRFVINGNRRMAILLYTVGRGILPTETLQNIPVAELPFQEGVDPQLFVDRLTLGRRITPLDLVGHESEEAAALEVAYPLLSDTAQGSMETRNQSHFLSVEAQLARYLVSEEDRLEILVTLTNLGPEMFSQFLDGLYSQLGDQREDSRYQPLLTLVRNSPPVASLLTWYFMNEPESERSQFFQQVALSNPDFQRDFEQIGAALHLEGLEHYRQLNRDFDLSLWETIEGHPLRHKALSSALYAFHIFAHISGEQLADLDPQTTPFQILQRAMTARLILLSYTFRLCSVGTTGEERTQLMLAVLDRASTRMVRREKEFFEDLGLRDIPPEQKMLTLLARLDDLERQGENPFPALWWKMNFARTHLMGSAFGGRRDPILEQILRDTLDTRPGEEPPPFEETVARALGQVAGEALEMQIWRVSIREAEAELRQRERAERESARKRSGF